MSHFRSGCRRVPARLLSISLLGAMLAAAPLMSAKPAFAGQHFQWNSSAASTWGTGGSWTYTDTGTPTHLYPQADYDYALLTSASLTGTIPISVDVTNALMIDLQFAGSANYTITSSNGTNALQFQEYGATSNDGEGAGVPYIEVNAGATGAYTISAPISVVSSANNTAFIVDSESAAASLLISGSITQNAKPVTFTGPGNITSSGIISGTSTVTKNGVGTLTLSGTNTYSGGTSIASGSGNLLVTNSSGLGSGTVTVNGNNAAAGTLQLSGGITLINAVATPTARNAPDAATPGYADVENVSGTNTISGSGYGINSGGLGDNIVSDSGTLTLSGNLSGNVSGSTYARPYYLYGAGNGLISGVIAAGNGAGTDVIKEGSGTWILAGANAYAGGTTVSGGTLAVSSASGLGTGGVTLSGGTLGLRANVSTGAFTLGTGTSFLDFQTSNTNVTFADSSSSTFSGSLYIEDYASGDHFYVSGAGLTGAQLADIYFTNPNGMSGTFAAAFSGGQVVVGASSAPEPGSLSMLGAGCVGLVALVVRRRGRAVRAA